MTKRLEKPRSRLGRRILLLALLLTAIFLFWREQNVLQMETIHVPGAPPALQGFRIVLISDVHGKEFGADNETLLAETAKLSPDLIAVTGDLIHDKSQFAMVPALAQGLSAIAPTYYVTGNHEWAAGGVAELKTLLRENGVTVLSNEYECIEIGGQTLAVLGIDDPNGRADQKTLSALAAELRQNEGDCYTLLLSHRNHRFAEYAAAEMDVTLAGHAHGGMIRLPFTGTDGLISPGPDRGFFPTHTAGRYDLAYGQLVVSRGLGNQFPAFRLFNRPHLPLIILEAE